MPWAQKKTTASNGAGSDCGASRSTRSWGAGSMGTAASRQEPNWPSDRRVWLEQWPPESWLQCRINWRQRHPVETHCSRGTVVGRGRPTGNERPGHGNPLALGQKNPILHPPGLNCFRGWSGTCCVYPLSSEAVCPVQLGQLYSAFPTALGKSMIVSHLLFCT